MKRFSLLFLALIGFLSACSSSIWQEYRTQPGDTLLQDDFSQSNAPWPVGRSDLGETAYYNGAYRVIVNAPNADFRTVAGKRYANIRLDILVGKFGGPDANRAGLICRYVDAGNFYAFIVTSDGFYGIAKMQDGQFQILGQDAFTSSAAVHRGMTLNQLRAECQGDQLRFYVNGILLQEVQDTSFASGDVGFLAGAFDEPGVDILFDDFLVVKLAP